MRVDADITLESSIIQKKKTGISLRCQDLSNPDPTTNFYTKTSADSTDLMLNTFYSDTQLICGFNFKSLGGKGFYGLEAKFCDYCDVSSISINTLPTLF